MGVLKEWVRSIVCYLCFMQIIDQLLPNGSYRKYMRFFCGLVFIVITLSPFMDVAGLTEKMEQEWRVEALKEDWATMNLEQEGLEQLREQTIREACEEELVRQVEEVAAGNGLENAEAEIVLSESSEEVLKIEQVRITGVCGGEEETLVCEGIRNELAAVYQISGTQVSVNIKGGGMEYGG